MSADRLDVTLIPAFDDNYIYLLRDPQSSAVGIVDAGDAAPALAALEAHGLTPTHLFATHHHGDHIGGFAEMKARTGAPVIGPADERIATLDKPVRQGDRIPFGTLEATVIEVPGHTRTHIALWFEAADALFCGDTLFALGCGRVMEGTMPQMWESLSKLAALPDATRVYCGHEYTQGNAKFALRVDPDNAALIDRAEQVRVAREKGEPTIPSTLAEERRTNPFLRADRAELARAVGLDGVEPAAVFGALRSLKDKG